ncbi:WXG100 family type VII secretion target [Amycolatopsis pittospori]|uniref:WXG100 family type VII secretion target n=1 Tax=Amycolatopsis pittospori TaxID=2749434 RepID=UPI0015F04467|nr:WXG100 family type VII secretion target [Amycolatopsis pittospori]
MANPLVADAVSSTTWASGVPLFEEAQGVKSSIESGDWASAVMGVAGTAMEALSMVADPFGSVLAAGVGWLMEHVGPLKEALDKLAGDPDQITAQAQTWQNIAKELASVGEDLVKQVDADVRSWAGQGADAYRAQTSDLAALISAAGEASAGAGSGVQTAGEVVAAVRGLVRDIIAEVVARLVSWALQVLATFGIGLTWVVPQVAALVAKTATKIATLVKTLITALKKLSGLLRKAGDVFGKASDGFKKIKPGKAPGRHSPGPLHDPGKTGPSKSGGGSRALDESPGKPDQHPYGGVDVPQSAHEHVTLGNLKPPRPRPPGSTAPPRPWGFSGGHMLQNDLPPGTAPHNTPGPNGRPNWHGAGVNGGNPPVFHGPAGPPPHSTPPAPPGTGPYGSYPDSNGVYNLHHPTMADPHGGNAGKPMSTMFPQGLNQGIVQNLGDQAWNGGNPNGGITAMPPRPGGGPQSYQWQGQGQIPFTPIWNPGGADHGSGSGNHPNAGSTINMSGFANPNGTAGPGGFLTPPTYYPDGRMDPPVKFR